MFHRPVDRPVGTMKYQPVGWPMGLPAGRPAGRPVGGRPVGWPGGGRLEQLSATAYIGKYWLPPPKNKPGDTLRQKGLDNYVAGNYDY